MTVLMDGGIMSGTDVLTALACGADAVLAGRAFMLGLAALGADGARHVAETMMDELRIALAQSGACDVAGTATLPRRHREAWRAEEFEVERTGAMRAAPTGSEPSVRPLEIQYRGGRDGSEQSDPAATVSEREASHPVANAKDVQQ
jgi:L-lactate dehydrogenase (cytochrome)